jgi:hypothetical protein
MPTAEAALPRNSLRAPEKETVPQSCHCEEPQATKQSRPGVGCVAPRLLRFARNDSLCGVYGFMLCGSETPVTN